MINYEKLMNKCIELAKQGEGKVSPNPLVGSLVLDEDNNVVGQGFHEQYGEAHAEVNAIAQAGEKAVGGTIFVNLEPCSHYGKTPPCADLIIKSGLKKLVVGMTDPNPKVAGSGLKKCKDAGIEVITGVLEDECSKLNEIFIKHITQNKPFVSIKTAMTLDGKIATKTGSSKWITSALAREEVQKMRNKYDAILTGSNTVLIDNPSMTCRMKNGKNPIRVVVDSQLKTSFNSKIFEDDGTKIFIAIDENLNNGKMKEKPTHITFIKCPLINNKINLEYLALVLFQNGIRSILIEAGGVLNGAFLKSGIVDKIYAFIAPKVLGDSEAKSIIEGFDIQDINNCCNLEMTGVKQFLPDILLEYKVKMD